METIKIIGSQQTYTSWCHRFEKEVNDVAASECAKNCVLCPKLDPLYLIHEIPIAMHA